MHDRMSAPFLPGDARRPRSWIALARFADESLFFRELPLASRTLWRPARIVVTSRRGEQIPLRTGAERTALEPTVAIPGMTRSVMSRWIASRASAQPR